jgi:hypothetical protein
VAGEKSGDRATARRVVSGELARRGAGAAGARRRPSPERARWPQVPKLEASRATTSTSRKNPNANQARPQRVLGHRHRPQGQQPAAALAHARVVGDPVALAAGEAGAFADVVAAAGAQGHGGVLEAAAGADAQRGQLPGQHPGAEGGQAAEHREGDQARADGVVEGDGEQGAASAEATSATPTAVRVERTADGRRPGLDRKTFTISR